MQDLILVTLFSNLSYNDLCKRILDFICPLVNSSYFWTNYGQMSSVKKYTSFGEHLRKLREEAGQTLKTVAEQINIDISLLAKIERDERQANKHLIRQVSTFFHVDEKELYNEFLSDQIAYKILEEEADLNILKVAEKKVSYLKTKKNVN